MVLVAAVASPAIASAGTSLRCTRTTAPGGEWRMYGHDFENTRSQPEESALTPAAVARITRAWKFTAADGGVFNSTPAVARGCVYIGSDTGVVYALDADTGAVVWQRHVAPLTTTAAGGAIVGSPAIVGGEVIVLVNQDSGPYAVSLDAANGAVTWQSGVVDPQPGAYTNASPMVFDGVLFFGLSAPEGLPGGQGGWALLDASTGGLLELVRTIPPEEQQRYSGGGIWSTPAFDAYNDYAYVGAGNPFNKSAEHRYTNSILKIDMDRSRPTFGMVVGYYKGNVDQYTDALATLSETPACAASDLNGMQWPLDDPVCGQLDLDFGASPNLFRDTSGNLLVGELQKSGIYHAAHADQMTPAWSAAVGLSCAFCNAASTAFDGTSIAGVGTPGGFTFTLDRSTGQRRWLWPTADVLHYQSMSAAAGVVYTVGGDGDLIAIDTATAAPIVIQSINGEPTPHLGSSGVAIAMHTLFAPVKGTIAAFRVP
jgi:polyvinyl alcohol dehydrogenase (cytochrome)